MIFSKYLSNERMSGIVSDESLIRYMIQFEIALVNAQRIDEMTKKEIVGALQKLRISPSDLAEGTLKNGIPVVPFVDILKQSINSPHLHYKATSQDVMDTAQSMILRDAIVVLKEDATKLIGSLVKLRSQYGKVKCMARTRGQLAEPFTFGVRIDSWLLPIERLLSKLTSSTVTYVQYGGPVGANNDPDIVNSLAKELNLTPMMSWHSQRDSLAEFTNWLATLTGALGKVGADIMTMAQNEVGEVEVDGGKSSAMAHKNNPVLCEALVALATINAGLQSIQLQSVIHSSERDGSALILEWTTIPQMLIYTATSLRHALTTIASMKVKADVMEKNVETFLKK